MDHLYKDDGLLCWWRRWRPGVGSPGHEFVEQLWSNIKKQCQCLITPDWFLPEQYQYILWTALFIFLRILVLSAFKSSVPPVTNLTDFIKLNQWVSEMTCRIGFTWFDVFFTGVLCFLHFNVWAQQSTAVRDFIISSVIQLMPMNHLFWFDNSHAQSN